MDLTLYFPISFTNFSLGELLRSELEKVSSRVDSFSVERDIERLQVAAGYVSSYFCDRSWEEIRVSDIVRIDGYAVAERLAPELDEHGKAGIARTVANLVARACACAADRQTMLLS
jgi:hypothetical protein